MLFHCQKRLPTVYDDGSRDDSSSNSFTSVDVTEKEMCAATHESHKNGPKPSGSWQFLEMALI